MLAAAPGDRAASMNSALALLEAIASLPWDERTPSAARCLGALYEGRRFSAVRALSDVLLQDDETQFMGRAGAAPSVDDLQAHRAESFRRVLGARGLLMRVRALVETGDYLEADRLSRAFRQIMGDDPEATDDVNREVVGLRGDAYRARYVACAARGEFEPQWLQRAVEAYAEAYAQPSPKSLAHGVDLLALVTRAEEDNVGLPPTARFDRNALADELVALADDPARQSDPYLCLSAAEACVALGRWDEAQRRLGDHLAPILGTRWGAYEVDCTIKELRDVWRLERKPVGDPARAVLEALEAAASRAVGAAPAPVPQAPRANPLQDQLSLRLNETRAPGAQTQTFVWVELLSARGKAVAQVVDRQTRRGFGSGFLVRGGDLFEPWGDAPVFVTNYHVVNRVGGLVGGDSEILSLKYQNAAAHFTRSDSDEPIAFEEILWLSPASALDVCVLRLASAPIGVRPIPVSPTWDVAPSAVTVIGHPLGGELALSLENLEVVEIVDAQGPRGLLRYTAATAGGSSGGPVLDWCDLSLAAIHHKGAVTASAPAVREAAPPTPRSAARPPRIFIGGRRADQDAGAPASRRRREEAPAVAPSHAEDAAALVVNEGVLMGSIIAAIAANPSGA